MIRFRAAAARAAMLDAMKIGGPANAQRSGAMPNKEEDEGYLAAERDGGSPRIRILVVRSAMTIGGAAGTPRVTRRTRKKTRAIGPLKPDIRCPRTPINPAQSGINNGGGTGTSRTMRSSEP